MIKLLISVLLVGNLYGLALPLAKSEAPENADPLRWLYQVERDPAPVVADVLRGPYNAQPVQKAAVADVLRGPYDDARQETSIFAVVPGTRYEDGGFIPPAGTDILRVPYEKMCCSGTPAVVDAGAQPPTEQNVQDLEKMAQASQNWADYSGEAAVVVAQAEGYEMADRLRYPYEWEDHQGAAPVLAYIAQQEAAKVEAANAEAASDSTAKQGLGH